MPRDEPGFVVARGELDERGTQLFDRIEGLQLQQVFLQGSYEAFGDAVALGFTNEGGRSLVPQSNVMPAAFKFVALGKPRQRLRDVLQLWPYQSALPVRLPEGQLTGASRDIGEKAQRDAGFLSELRSGDLTRIYDGHELEEYRTRLQEEERQQLISTLHT